MICCIAGMHRSGTSLTAAWLEACGLVLAEGGFIPPNTANPKGYFEDSAFVRLHSKSIARQKRWTSGWRISPLNSLVFSPSEVNIALRLAGVRQTKYGAWGWKDPRSTLFLAHWKQLIPELKVVIVWRPAAEVLFSLLRRWQRRPTRRNWIDPFEGLRLWRAYNLLACQYAAAWPRETLLLPLSQIIQQDRRVLELLNTAFAGQLAYTAIKTLYEPELIHAAQAPPWISLLSRAAGCAAIQQRLQDLSAAV